MGYTFDANESTRFFVNLLAGRTQSNDYDQRGIPHMASPWTTQIFVDNAYLPAAVRQAMVAQGVNNFVMEKQGQWLGQSGNWGDSEDRHNQFDSWTLQLGFDKDIGDNWQMQARIQRGATDRLSQVFNEIRVDREMLAVDAVEVYNDRRDLTGDTIDPATGNYTGAADGRPDLVNPALRGTGTILCNVQRYNPTQAQLQAAVANIRVPAAQGDSSLGNGDPTFPVPIPSPVGPDAIPNCVPMNIFGQGNVSAAAAGLRGLGEVRRRRRHAGVRRGPVHGRHLRRLRARRVLDGRRRHVARAVVLAGRVARGSHALRSAGQRARTSASAVSRAVSRPAARTSTSSRRCPRSVAGTTSGRPSPSSTCRSGSRTPARSGSSSTSRGATRTTRRAAASTRTRSVSTCKAAEFLRFRTTVSRDVREPTFAERFDVQGGGGSITEHAIANIPTPDGLPRPGSVATVFQITSTALGNPDLTPEEADTITAGFVVEPASTGLQFSVDWYDIDLAGAIGQLGVQRIVNECNVDRRERLVPVRVPRPGHARRHRRPQSVAQHQQRARSRARLRALVEPRPRPALGAGRGVVAAVLGRPAARGQHDDAGRPARRTLPGNSAEPENRALLSARYRFGDFGVGWQQRYIGEAEINDLTITFVQFQPGLVPTGTQLTIDDATIDAKSYSDLSFTYGREMSSGQSWELSLVAHERVRRGSAGHSVLRPALQLAGEPGERVRRVRPPLAAGFPLPAVVDSSSRGGREIFSAAAVATAVRPLGCAPQAG